MLKTQFTLFRPWRVIIYARMSTEQQNPRSPDQQINTIRETIQRLGLRWEIVAIYRDDGISARFTRKRTQFQQMMRDIKSGTIQAGLVLVDTFERFSRADNADELRRQLKKLGLLLLTADSGFLDPTTTAGKALAMVESIRATEDGRVKAHNVLRGKKDAILLGHWPGGPVPLGYKLKTIFKLVNGVDEIDHRILEPDPETRWIPTEMHRLADEHGWGAGRIAKKLNSDSRVPKALKPIPPATVGESLDRETYCGDYVWGRNCTDIIDDVRVLQALPESEWVRKADFCEPLVSREVKNRVLAMRDARRKILAESRKKKSVENESVPGLRYSGIALKYPLTGLVRCAHCGRSMTPSSSAEYVTKAGETRRYVSYVCPGTSGGLCTNRKSIPEAWLRETIMVLVRERLFFGT